MSHIRPVRFTYEPHPGITRYRCNFAGNHTGDYVKLDIADELLEACKVALEVLERISQDNGIRVRGACDQLEAAIKKAEGAI